MSAGLSIGEIRYLVIRHLPSEQADPLTKYPRFPIYGRFKVVLSGAAKIDEPFSSGWERMDNFEYWYPYSQASKFVTRYNSGDEYTIQKYQVNQTEVTAKRGPIYTYSELNDPSGVKAHKLTNVYTPGTLVESLRSNLYYQALDSYVRWDALNESGTSPYGEFLQVWKKIYLSTNPSPSVKDVWYYWRDDRYGRTIFRAMPKNVIFGPLPNRQFVEFSSLLDGKDRYLTRSGLTVPPRTDTDIPAGAEPGPGMGGGGTGSGTSSGGRSSTQRTDDGTDSAGRKATISTTVKVRGNYGLISPGQQPSSEPQMVQYYKRGSSIIQEPDRHIFLPKPNQINYENIGSEWTEIERVGRIPLVDWKNFRLMKISFQFLVLPTSTYRLGAFGETADEQITLSIDDQLERLRNMAARPYPVILYGFDDLLTNSSPFVMSSGAGVQFVITDFRISSLLRTPEGAINRATCDVSMQEVPIEYINIVSFPKLVPGTVIPGKKKKEDDEYGSNQDLTTTRLREI